MISVLSKLVMKKLNEKEFEEEHDQVEVTEFDANMKKWPKKEIRHGRVSNSFEESGVKNAEPMSSSTGSFSATPTLLNQKICDKKMKSNFKDQDTSLKTKSGVINDVNDGIYIVKCPDEEIYVDLSDLQYNFIKNDKVTLTGEATEENFDIPVQFEVKTMRPAVLKTEFGRVTKIQDEFLVFEAKILLIKSTIPSLSIQIHQECQYDMIESDQKIDGELFKWRVVNVLKIVEDMQPKSEGLESVKKSIIISSPAFVFPMNAASRVSKHVAIKNKSSESVKLLKCYIRPPNSEIVKLCKEKKENGNVLYILKPKDEKSFQLHLQIFPQVLGMFAFEIFADFQTSKDENFTKSYKFHVEICHELNLLTGPKFRNYPRFCDIRFKDYFIPDEIREFDFLKPKEIVENLKKKFPFLDELTITSQNYVEKLRFAIYLDEIAMEIAFKSYHIPKACFEESNGYLKLAVKDVAEKRPSIIMGDAVEVSDPYRDEKNQMFYRGYIYKVENDAVLIKFHEEFHESHRNKEYTINFFFSRTSYKQQNHAIEKVVNELGFDFLFPVKIPSRHLSIYVELSNDGMLKDLFRQRKLQWFDSKLDKYQKQAVVNAMRGECRPMPYIIYGPAGSGKTCTIVELIKQIFILDKTTRIIVATPSNSAANLFTSALIASGMFKNSLDFIRLVSNIQVEKCLIPDYLKRHCATVSINSNPAPGEKWENSEVRKNMTKIDIMDYRICISTLSCFGNLMQMNFPDDHFSHVIIDEAGQSTEAESLIPISLLAQHKGQVVLAGDPLQLGPCSNSRYVKSLKLDYSLLERLLDTNECYAQNSEKQYDPHFVTQLKINYRSLPSILKVYNDLFYNSELEGAVNSKNSSEAEMFSILVGIDNLFPKTISRSCGTFFVDVVKGKNRRVPDSCSWYNDEEMNSIISFLSKLNVVGIDFKDIGIITPYALQVKKFKHKISVALPGTDLKIGTVEEFQGEERLIILVSTVRTDERHFNSDAKYSLGFLQCKKRMNVAISRAKSMLVVFGKAECLKKDEKWTKLITYTQENGTFVTDDRT